MKEIQDGGPAFPNLEYTRHLREGERYELKNGMTLRDWFAGQAINNIRSVYDEDEYDQLSKQAYKIADALLAEREK